MQSSSFFLAFFSEYNKVLLPPYTCWRYTSNNTEYEAVSCLGHPQ